MRDLPNWVLFLWRLALAALLVTAVAWIGWKFSGRTGLLIGFLLATPLAAALIARYVVELMHEGFSWLWHQPMQEWQGSFYAFDDVQVRIYEHEDQLWFAVADVLTAIDQRRLTGSFLATHSSALLRVPGTRVTALALPGLEALLGPSRDPKAGRLLQWARREVVAPWERKQESASRTPGRPRA